jgi:hypothetical protein
MEGRARLVVMRSILLRASLCGLIAFGALPLWASVPAGGMLRPVRPEVSLLEQNLSDSAGDLESLREDVGRHPEDFVAFETRTSANRFIAEHEGAFHETERRVVLRGVVGYWQGKTLVVLPSLSIGSRL